MHDRAGQAQRADLSLPAPDTKQRECVGCSDRVAMLVSPARDWVRRHGQVVRRGTANPLFPGSNPGAASKINLWITSPVPIARDCEWPSQRGRRVTARRYDVALSFAGEDREFARRVADLLSSEQVSVFFDESELVNLWGKDLAVELAEIYGKQADFVILFVSKAYVTKAWPQHEFRNSLAAAIGSAGERILPVRLDDSELPGLRATIAYLDGRTNSPERVARAVLEKLGLTAPGTSASLLPSAVVTIAPPSPPADSESEDDLSQRIRQRGYWQTVILPSQIKEDRLKISRGLIPLLRQQAVDLRGWDFPHVDLNTPPQIESDSIGQDTEWDHFHELWRLFKSGKFLHLAGMRHDWGASIQLSLLETAVPGQPLIGVGDAIFRFTEIVEFGARFTEAFLSAEEAAICVEVGGLRGRRLVIDDPHRYGHRETFVATTRRPFMARIEVARGYATAMLRARARDCARELYALFGYEISEAVLQDWQGKIGSW
jgi:hypothetical protein